MPTAVRPVRVRAHPRRVTLGVTHVGAHVRNRAIGAITKASIGSVAKVRLTDGEYGPRYMVGMIEKVGRVNVTIGIDVQFRPDGPIYHQSHKLPIADIVEVRDANTRKEPA